MHRRTLLTLVLSGVALLALSGAPRADAPYRLSGPHTHENLTIYFVHGESAAGPVPLTLQEAMARGAVHVHETSNVNELQIENLGDQEVFVQSGDIVKGGKQDRVLMVSLILPPRSGRLPIASFCVEQGRWSARGREDVARFSSAESALPSRRAKVAMKAPLRPPAEAAPVDGRSRADGLSDQLQRLERALRGRHGERAGGSPPSETGMRQQAVWRSVAAAQQSLSGALGQPVAAPQSRSSLQLSLENEKLRAMQLAYVKALESAVNQHGDVIGFVFAINGRLNSADIYPSAGLFRKMWPKLLRASVTEAIGERHGKAEELPAFSAVLAFLRAAEGGERHTRDLNAALRLDTRDGEKTLYVATERTQGGWVHKNYLAK